MHIACRSRLCPTREQAVSINRTFGWTRYERKLKRLQRQLSRKAKGSRNGDNTRIRVAKAQREASPEGDEKVKPEEIFQGSYS